MDIILGHNILFVRVKNQINKHDNIEIFRRGGI